MVPNIGTFLCENVFSFYTFQISIGTYFEKQVMSENKQPEAQPTQSFIQSDLINVAGYGKEKITFNPDRGDIQFYCHACKKVVETDRPHPRKVAFVCKDCGSKNIAIGTQEGLREHYDRKG